VELDTELEREMVRYQAGEIESFDRIYSRLSGPLLGFLRRLAPPGTDAEDLVQTTFLQIHRARATYRPGRPVRPWVYAIARNVALMSVRSGLRRRKREAPLEDVALETAPAPEQPLREAGRLELERLLGRLADEGREALWLHRVEGFSFREVAAIQGVLETTAKVRAFRALESLRAAARPGSGE